MKVKLSRLRRNIYFISIALQIIAIFLCFRTALISSSGLASFSFSLLIVLILVYSYKSIRIIIDPYILQIDVDAKFILLRGTFRTNRFPISKDLELELDKTSFDEKLVFTSGGRVNVLRQSVIDENLIVIKNFVENLIDRN